MRASRIAPLGRHSSQLWALSLALFLLMTPYICARTTRGPSSKLKSQESRWVESALARMTLRQKIGQMLMPAYFGGFTPVDDPAYKDLMHEVTEDGVGGFILGTRTGPLGIEIEKSQAYSTAVLTNQLQRAAKFPLLVSADFERGTNMRLDEGTSFPSNMAVAATGRPEDAFTIGTITAKEARAVGVSWILAPVSDVNDNPDNPIINIRSYGEDPGSVARFVTEFIRGVQQNGALATAKHFPGHGNVSVDSHVSLPTVPGDLARLESVELVPFRAAIGAGVATIMTGHLAVPALEPDPSTPATLSSKVLQGFLRGQLNFHGLIVADALEMGGITSLYSPADAAVRAVGAGVDVLLMPLSPRATITALEDAVYAGRLSEARIDESVRRILTAKARLGLNKNRLVNVDALNREIRKPSYGAAALDIAARSVTVLRDTPHMLPLDSTRPTRYLLVSISADADAYPGSNFEEELRTQVDSLTALRADTQFASVSNLKLPPSDSYDTMIIALFVRVADHKGNVGMHPDQVAFVQNLLASGKPALVACFGSPYLIAHFPRAPTWVSGFGSEDTVQRATARAIFGQTEITGTLPVTIPGVAARGAGLDIPENPMRLQPAPARMASSLAPVFAMLDCAVDKKIFPGGVLAVGLRDQFLIHPFGALSYTKNAPRVREDTIYDAASLTKPIVTTTAAMILVERDLLDLNAPISRYLPEWNRGSQPDWRSKAIIRELLEHSAGLPAHKDYFLTAKNRQALLASVFAEPLEYQPGTKIVYSDLGFILLGEIVERLTGLLLDQFAENEIFQPLGMKDSQFNPPRVFKSRIAPTEFDSAFRKRLLQGEVDDSNAYVMKGIAGHAGLFTTAGDLSIFSQMMLNGGIYAQHRLVARATIAEFTERVTIGDSARAIGWDVPVQPSASGGYFSPASYGHLGYTGTSLWIDPERSLFVILLTNRVNPSAGNDKIRTFRPELHDAILQALGLVSTRPTPRK
jgi:beta-N-acetylhexosaminidase